MWRRLLIALLITGAAFFLLGGGVDRDALAQDLESRAPIAQKSAGVQDVTETTAAAAE